MKIIITSKPYRVRFINNGCQISMLQNLYDNSDAGMRTLLICKIMDVDNYKRILLFTNTSYVILSDCEDTKDKLKNELRFMFRNPYGKSQSIVIELLKNITHLKIRNIEKL